MPVVKGLLAEVWRVGKEEGCGWAEVAVCSLCGLFVISRLYRVSYSLALVCSRFKVLILLFWLSLFHSGNRFGGSPLNSSTRGCCSVPANSTSRLYLLFQFPVGPGVAGHFSQGIFLRAL